jgi:hypothetical protein
MMGVLIGVRGDLRGSRSDELSEDLSEMEGDDGGRRRVNRGDREGKAEERREQGGTGRMRCRRDDENTIDHHTTPKHSGDVIRGLNTSSHTFITST